MSIASEIARGTRRTAHAGAVELDQFRSRIDKGMRELRKEANRRIDATDKYVHGHPWKSMAIAAGAAALIGVATAQLLHRRQ